MKIPHDSRPLILAAAAVMVIASPFIAWQEWSSHYGIQGGVMALSLGLIIAAIGLHR